MYTAQYKCTNLLFCKLSCYSKQLYKAIGFESILQLNILRNKIFKNVLDNTQNDMGILSEFKTFKIHPLSQSLLSN